MRRRERLRRNYHILKLYASGQGYRSIAREVGLSKSGVRDVVKDNRMYLIEEKDSNCPTFLSVIVENLSLLYPPGASRLSVQRAFNWSKSLLSRVGHPDLDPTPEAIEKIATSWLQRMHPPPT